MLRIVFSSHALYQMRERNIPRRLVIATLNYPDRTAAQSNQRVRAVKLFKRNKKKYLIVTIYEERANVQKVITVFITSKIKKFLNSL
ncbi:MAG: hypothetical protein UU96_C0013G0009 [Parcubacteria group bacterium GW2011_GWC2_42_13]|nr:MAG: hypothetical protein UU96_C0013G0009 [Parcubacteria group bacterium GW2011_GWC2_42_13]